MKKIILLSLLTLIVGVILTACSGGGDSSSSSSVIVSGAVSSGGAQNALPISGATVSIYQAQATSANLLAKGTSDSGGNFSISIPTDGSGNVYYAIATSGTSTQLMALLGATPLQNVTINEMTTVAAAYAMLQFNRNGIISGPQLSLQIASSMAENLVSAQTGAPSTLIQLEPNANQTNTWRELGTLANILTACVRTYSGGCTTLFANALTLSGTRPETTLEAISNIARNPGANLANLFALGNTVRAYAPYLLSTQGPSVSDITQQLDGWTLSVKFNNTGSTLYPYGGPAYPVFDKNGYVWIGNNVIQGTGNSTNCVVVLKPNGQPSDGKNGTPISPICNTGGLLGSGYGIAIDPMGNVWGGNFGWGDSTYIPGNNPGQEPGGGSVTQLNAQGTALSPSSGWINGTLRPQGIASDASGNIWIANYKNNTTNIGAMVVYPKGNPVAAISYIDTTGTNKGGFGVAIAPDGTAWVTYTSSGTLMHYKLINNEIVPIDAAISLPGSSLKGVAVDARGNVWAAGGASNLLYAYNSSGVALPNSPYNPYTGGGVNGTWGPWGVSIDALGNIWVASFGDVSALIQSGKFGVMAICGATPANCPPGRTTGSAISPTVGFTLPSAGDPVLLSDGQPVYDDVTNLINSHKPIMRQTNAQPDSAGNIWVMNNWKPSIVQNLLGIPFDPNGVPNPGGDGVVVIIGVGAPTKGPLIGPAQSP